MTRHDVDVLIERDGDGLIRRAGAAWMETSPSAEQMLIAVCAGSLLATVGGGLWALATRDLNPVLVLGLVGLIGSVILIIWKPGPSRAVYFHADGRIQTPFGIAYRSSLPGLGGHHRDIVSIEARAQHDQPQVEGGWERMFEVIVLFYGGDLICVSRDLHEWVALKAAAQLTIALNSIRREQADDALTTYAAWVAAD